MKRTLAVSLALYLAVFLIPLLTAGQAPLPPEGPSPSPPEETGPPSAAEEEPPEPELPEPVPPPELPDGGAAVTVLAGGTARELTLREFLYGAVAAEMPALYPEEALKAQAVAIRTFALYASGRPYHEDALLCGNPDCCLAFAPLPERGELWGGQYEEFAQKVINAVDETDGVVILYENRPVEAVFFAATDGRTRSAEEVWGTDVPYLQSVESAFDEEFPNGPRGHGVGMSQFGARQLALSGLSYEEILRWYYTGVEVARWG